MARGARSSSSSEDAMIIYWKDVLNLSENGREVGNMSLLKRSDSKAVLIMKIL
jgi:hypothetical protein